MVLLPQFLSIGLSSEHLNTQQEVEHCSESGWNLCLMEELPGIRVWSLAVMSSSLMELRTWGKMSPWHEPFSPTSMQLPVYTHMKTTKEACFSSPLLQVKKQARGKYVPCLMTHIRNTILRNIRIGPLVFLIQFSAQPKLTPLHVCGQCTENRFWGSIQASQSKLSDRL